ncbi:hypothetical protein [Faecalicatena orotica]|uniref:hypothetical protein n=1 Tax=Faecalicatena orotica TaxID=1544 RepID=UPI001FA8785E
MVPFCTHGGSALGRSEGDIASLVPDDVLPDSLAVSGSSVDGAQADVEEWLNKRAWVAIAHLDSSRQRLRQLKTKKEMMANEKNNRYPHDSAPSRLNGLFAAGKRHPRVGRSCHVSAVYTPSCTEL